MPLLTKDASEPKRPTMALDNFTGESDASSAQPPKTTYYQFENPDHPESKEHDDPDVAKRHFEAARYVQNRLGTDRHNLVGEFLVAVHDIEEDDDPSELEALVERLTS